MNVKKAQKNEKKLNMSYFYHLEQFIKKWFAVKWVIIKGTIYDINLGSSNY